MHSAKAQTGMRSGTQTDRSLSDVKKKGKLVVGVDIPYGVTEFFDKSGTPVGIDMDISHEIASTIGVAWEIKAMSFSKLFDSLKNRDVDVVISAVTITPERQKTMRFSVPYLDAGLTIAVRKDNTDIQLAEDLKGKKVGVLKGTTSEQYVKKLDVIDPSFVMRCENNNERVEDLVKGKLDAIIVHFLTEGHQSIKIVGVPLTQAFYGVVTRLNDKALMDEINKTLRDLKRNGRLNEIRQKYMKRRIE